MLRSFHDYGAVFVEITKADHLHGGAGWEFGTCLWSPTRNRAGADRYALMREPAPGNLILHFYKNVWPDGTHQSRLAGHSTVAAAFRQVDQEPPSPGDWQSMGHYYRIALRDYGPFNAPVPLDTLKDDYADQIRRDIIDNRPRFYPFNTYGDRIATVQGIYLARATPTLYNVFREALGVQEAQDNQEPAANLHDEYREARRFSSERYFFSRNPQLARDIKDHYHYICQGCFVDFSARFDGMGRRALDCHHLNPLSERAEEEWTQELRTSLDEVTALCAICHRIIHAMRPPMTIARLRQTIGVVTPPI